MLKFVRWVTDDAITHNLLRMRLTILTNATWHEHFAGDNHVAPEPEGSQAILK